MQRRCPASSFMQIVMLTECSLFARHYSRGQGLRDEQVQERSFPLRACVLGREMDNRQGNL